MHTKRRGCYALSKGNRRCFFFFQFLFFEKRSRRSVYKFLKANKFLIGRSFRFSVDLMSIFVDINEEIQFVNTVVRLETVSTTGEILWQKIEEIDFLLFIIEFNWRVVNFSSERMTKGIDSPTGLKSPQVNRNFFPINRSHCGPWKFEPIN